MGTLDHNYILSCSDDTNIRLWKAHASKPIQQPTRREEAAMKYRKALTEKFSDVKEIQRIKGSRVHVPKYVRRHTEEGKIMEEAKERRVENHNKHVKGDPDKIIVRDPKKEVVVQKVD